VYGPPSACVEGVRAAVQAAAEMILFTPLSDYTRQMERLAGDVMPQL
jgi:hypothetical protein